MKCKENVILALATEVHTEYAFKHHLSKTIDIVLYENSKLPKILL